MGIFTKLTKRYLSKNKTRTIVTLIGIMISMALFTAVIEGAYSGYQFLKNREMDVVGSWQVMMLDVNEQGIQQLKDNEHIASYEEVGEVGYAIADNSNVDKPYLYVKSLHDGQHALFPITVTQGRLPENENELILSNFFLAKSTVDYQIGDTITLDIGNRYLQKEKLKENTPYLKEETLQNTTSHTFTIVGFMAPLRQEIEDFSFPGYYCFTTNMQASSQTVFATVDRPDQIDEIMIRQSISDTYTLHTNILRYYGVFKTDAERSVLIGLTAILVGMIAYGSISLIYNSFAISISERIRQFGILKSIGASNRQIRYMVIMEALFLAIVGITLGVILGCVGIGLTLAWVQSSFISLLMSSTTVTMRLIINPLPIAIAVSICLCTTMIAAYLPAAKAIRTPAIESIRLSDGIKIRQKDIKSSKVTQKLFGFAGLMASKNFKRNKRRYRSTIISLALSVILFISASALSGYVIQLMNIESSKSSSANVIYHINNQNAEEEDKRFAQIQELSDIKEATLSKTSFETIFIQRDKIAPAFWTPENQSDLPRIKDHVGINTRIVFMDDASFRKLCMMNGIHPDDYFDRQNPKAILSNNAEVWQPKGDIEVAITTNVIDTSLKNVDMFAVVHKSVEGYLSNHQPVVQDGKQYYLFYPEDYIIEHNGFDGLDMRKAIRYPIEEIDIQVPFTVQDQIEKDDFGFGNTYMELIYPKSMKDYVITEDVKDTLDHYATASIMIKTDHHTDVVEKLENIQKDMGWQEDGIYDLDRDKESTRAFILVMNVFSYGFIVLIALIAIANVFNTISTNITLRRKEFAMLRSVGMSEKSFMRMMNYECMIYGSRSLLLGLPISMVVTYAIYHVVNEMSYVPFMIPFVSILISIGMVFIVVFITMIYATRRIRKNNVIEELRIDNI